MYYHRVSAVEILAKSSLAETPFASSNHFPILHSHLGARE
jgi:hypothetical protein